MSDEPMGRFSIAADCVVHASHDPEPTYCEIHHVIPQAWQIHWQPPQPWPNQGPSPDRSGVMLWDARTIVVCRTGHGNIHYWLVKVTHEIASADDSDDSAAWMLALAEARAAALAGGHAPGHADVYWSMQAITRYADAGGSVGDLVAHKLWGEI